MKKIILLMCSTSLSMSGMFALAHASTPVEVIPMCPMSPSPYNSLILAKGQTQKCMLGTNDTINPDRTAVVVGSVSFWPVERCINIEKCNLKPASITCTIEPTQTPQPKGAIDPPIPFQPLNISYRWNSTKNHNQPVPTSSTQWGTGSHTLDSGKENAFYIQPLTLSLNAGLGSSYYNAIVSCTLN